MGLWTLLEACLIFVNALAIIDEERFLKPREPLRVLLHGIDCTHIVMLFQSGLGA